MKKKLVAIASLLMVLLLVTSALANQECPVELQKFKNEQQKWFDTVNNLNFASAKLGNVILMNSYVKKAIDETQQGLKEIAEELKLDAFDLTGRKQQLPESVQKLLNYCGMNLGLKVYCVLIKVCFKSLIVDPSGGCSAKSFVDYFGDKWDMVSSYFNIKLMIADGTLKYICDQYRLAREAFDKQDLVLEEANSVLSKCNSGIFTPIPTATNTPTQTLTPTLTPVNVAGLTYTKASVPVTDFYDNQGLISLEIPSGWTALKFLYRTVVLSSYPIKSVTDSLPSGVDVILGVVMVYQNGENPQGFLYSGIGKYAVSSASAMDVAMSWFGEIVSDRYNFMRPCSLPCLEYKLPTPFNLNNKDGAIVVTTTNGSAVKEEEGDLAYVVVKQPDGFTFAVFRGRKGTLANFEPVMKQIATSVVYSGPTMPTMTPTVYQSPFPTFTPSMTVPPAPTATIPATPVIVPMAECTAVSKRGFYSIFVSPATMEGMVVIDGEQEVKVIGKSEDENYFLIEYNDSQEGKGSGWVSARDIRVTCK